MGAPEPAQARSIRTVHDALAWGDEWMAAYHQQQAELNARIVRLSDEVFMTQTRAVILEAELLILRHKVSETLKASASETETA